MTRDPYGGNFKLARAQAFDRSGGTCQLCGTAQATDAHHWALDDYPSGEDVTADDLVALCRICHEVATTLRRTLRAGGNRFEIVHNITRSIASCSTGSEYPAPAPSSCTTGQPGLTPEALSAVRSQRSRPNAGGNRTETDDERLRELECRRSLWLDAGGAPAVPAAAVRAAIETGARRRKQGPQVRGGLVVLETVFEYDRERYGAKLEEIGSEAQFTVPVLVKGSRVNRTRARFDPPWSCTVTVDVDGELIDREQLLEWLEIAGRQVGLGDWRPEKSGVFGRFKVTSFEEVAECGHDGAGRGTA